MRGQYLGHMISVYQSEATQEKSEANENDDGFLCNLTRISWIVTGEVILTFKTTNYNTTCNNRNKTRYIFYQKY